MFTQLRPHRKLIVSRGSSLNKSELLVETFMTNTTAFVIMRFFSIDSGDIKKGRWGKKKRVAHTNTPTQAYYTD